MQKNEANQDDVDGVSDTGVMKNPSNLSIMSTTTQYTGARLCFTLLIFYLTTLEYQNTR